MTPNQTELDAHGPTVRIYVDSQPVDVSTAATAIAAVSAWSADRAAQIKSGSKVLVDDRGLPAALDAPVYNGAIFRVVSARQAAAQPDEESAT